MNEGECLDGCPVCLGPVGRWWGAAAGWVSLRGFFLCWMEVCAVAAGVI